MSKNTTGFNNVANGSGALYNSTTGSFNVADGGDALMSNIDGYGNVANGYDALLLNTSGTYNVANGYDALYSNTTASTNVADGSFALYSNTTGGSNVANGAYALYSNKYGNSNTVIGVSAGYNSTGSGNVFIGHSAGFNELSSNKLYIDNSSTSTPLIWGDFNSRLLNLNGKVGIGTLNPLVSLEVIGSTKSVTYTGSNSGTAQFQSWTDGSNQGLKAVYSFYPTFMGTADNGPRRAADIVSGFNNGAWGNEYLSFNVGSNGSSNDGQNLTSEKMRIVGNGNVGIGTALPGYRLTVNGTAWCTSGVWTGSDVRWKKNIIEIHDILHNIMSLKSVTYHWRTDEFPEMNFTNETQLGLIAQDVEKVFPNLVITDDNGFKAVSYEKLSVILLEGMKEQQQQIESYKSQLQYLQDEVARIKEKLAVTGK